MVPINFWQNSDPFLKKEHLFFLAQRLTELEYFLQISQIVNIRILKNGPKMFETVP